MVTNHPVPTCESQPAACQSGSVGVSTTSGGRKSSASAHHTGSAAHIGTRMRRARLA